MRSPTPTKPLRANEKAGKTGKYKKVCVTDPDASMATNGRNRSLEPAYKQHAVVNDACGVILDVEVTTGEINEGQVILSRLDAVGFALPALNLRSTAPAFRPMPSTLRGRHHARRAQG